jgi:hypothetical protein
LVSFSLILSALSPRLKTVQARTMSRVAFSALSVIACIVALEEPALGLSVCKGLRPGVRGDGPYPNHEDAPLEPVFWVRTCKEEPRVVAPQLAVNVPTTLSPLAVPLAVIERAGADVPPRLLVGNVSRAPDFTTTIHRVELAERLRPATQYEIVAYERDELDVRAVELTRFRTQSHDRRFDETLVAEWPGIQGYRSEQHDLGNFDWTEHRLAMGPAGRVPPLFRVDYLSETSPFARPVLSDLLFSNAEGNAFQGFQCGCGRSLNEWDDEERNIRWMRLTPLSPEGRSGSVFWARVVDGKLEAFPERDLKWRAARRWAVQLAFPVGALLALVVVLIRGRRGRRIAS